MVVTPAPPPIVLTNPTKLGSGAFQFSFTNTPGRSFTVFGISNFSVPFSNWTPLGGVTETAPGQFQFTDPQGGMDLLEGPPKADLQKLATNKQTRFYRVGSP